MLKLTKLLAIMILVFSGSNIANAQCVPDPNCVDPGGDGQYCPTEFTPAIEDEYYEEVLTIITPTDIQGTTIHHIDLLSIGNIPPGMVYECQDNDCSLWPQTPKCIKISGTPEIDSWGDYKLYLTMEIFIDIAGVPISAGVIEDSSSVVTIEPQLYADFEIAYGQGAILCNNEQTVITYTGDATDDAIYHWDFGDNASVVNGEGSGPYVIEYGNEYSGMDSISLYVQEAPYTSPLITEDFMVDYCLMAANINDKEAYAFYPNPIRDILNIRSLSFENARVVIYDLSGKEVLRSMLHQEITTIDVAFLQKGIYFLSMINSETTVTHKIVKK